VEEEMATTEKLHIAVTTTPRANKIDNIKEWLDWANGHFTGLPERCDISKLIAVMPTRSNEEVSKELNKLLPGGNRYWAGMEPGAIGAGDTFRGACFFAFADDVSVAYALHVPIDVDFSNPHEDDVQNNVKKLLHPVVDSLDERRPDLVIGDYVPMIWDEATGTAKESPFKALLEEHVREQLRHYFAGNIVDRLGILRPRSEFFLISRKLFEQVSVERRFWPWDPIPQILIYADRNGFRVERVWLGKFYEKKPKFDSTSIRDQVWRTAFQISSEWLRWEHKRELQPHEIRVLSHIWQATISEGMALAFKALERMLRDPHVV
jgi:hypothetical protein